MADPGDQTATEPAPADWPVLVTGASGFVGGHIARDLAARGHYVRALTRSAPPVEPGDPAIEWVRGDLRDPADRRLAVRGVRGVIHAASWVSLGADPAGLGVSTNVDATRGLLDDCHGAGVERFVYTSTLHTLAFGTREAPADEDSPWNLHRVDSPYARTKRRAEELVLRAGGGRLSTVALCPGMVLGTRDRKPTSTSLLIALARSPVAMLPGGGIPIVDARVVAQAHRRALIGGGAGDRFALAGPYVSFRDMAGLVRQVAGNARWTFPIPDACERPLVHFAGCLDRWFGGRWIEVSATTAAGGFLPLHVSGERADRWFGLVHPDPRESVSLALRDAQRIGLVPRLRPDRPEHDPGPVKVPGQSAFK